MTSAKLRPSLSTGLVIFFFLILLFLALFAEVFESRAPDVDLAQIYANPVPVNDLQGLKSLRITNKQGNFLFENTHAEGHLDGPWQMVEPQALKAKGAVVSKIMEALNAIRVRNFHRMEPINITSFSLDNPTLTLNFTTVKDRDYEIKMGLINPIDNSAYMGLSTQDQIYQIDPLEIALESYDMAQFVDFKVLTLNRESLVSLEIYGPTGPTLKLLKKEQQWLDQNGTVLSLNKVDRFFERLEEVKSTSFLDELTSEQREYLHGSMATPAYTLKIISSSGVRNYLLSEVKGQVPGLRTATTGLFALTSEEKSSFVFIEKEQLKFLGSRPSELK